MDWGDINFPFNEGSKYLEELDKTALSWEANAMTYHGCFCTLENGKSSRIVGGMYRERIYYNLSYRFEASHSIFLFTKLSPRHYFISYDLLRGYVPIQER